jgi:hypothetical protein
VGSNHHINATPTQDLIENKLGAEAWVDFASKAGIVKLEKDQYYADKVLYDLVDLSAKV